MQTGIAIGADATDEDRQLITLSPGDRAIVIGPETPLTRALNFPDGHPVLMVWRAAKLEYEEYDATCFEVAAITLLSIDR